MFYKSRERKDGLHPWCKICVSEHHKVYYKTHAKKHQHDDRRRRTSVSQDKYNQMFAKQDGRCAICGRPQSVLSRALAVDHNHRTGQVRSLLCGKCNTGIGMFNDNCDLIKLVLKYLSFWNKL